MTTGEKGSHENPNTDKSQETKPQEEESILWKVVGYIIAIACVYIGQKLFVELCLLLFP